MGLSGRALDFLEERNIVSTEIYDTNDEPDLLKYTLEDGSIVYEIVQEGRDFLALSRSTESDDIIEEAAWLEEEIQERIHVG